MTEAHIPVLLQEVMSYLRPAPGGSFIDGTVGAGGHSERLLEATAPNGRLLGIDRDVEALRFSSERLEKFDDRFIPVHGSFADVAVFSAKHRFERVDGILYDLGLSSRQLEDPERGFSFQSEGPLDMRFDQSRGQTASDFVNTVQVSELARVLRAYGELKKARQMAETIVANRPISSTRQLAELALGVYGRRGRTHPATLVFQALRMAVNEELANIERGLQAAVSLLRPGGRLAVISFHSLEDRLVKHFMRHEALDCICPPEQPVCTCDKVASLRLVKRKAIKATAEEIASNARSRSARLRIAERLVNR